MYESKPPEQQRRPRHHSRTPSVKSSCSIAESRAGIRKDNGATMERRVNGKRSMKFSSSPFKELGDLNERQYGTVRSHQPRHYGRWGRGGSHASMFNQDSPFTQASKLRGSATGLQNPRPHPPQNTQSMQQNHASGSALFGGREKKSSFDFGGEGADDERTPLVGAVRTPKSSRHGHTHIHSSGANLVDEYYSVGRRSRCGRLGGCMLGLAVILTVVLSAVAFSVLTNRPMYGVQIENVQDVLVSEQEIKLDLLVRAVNPNAFRISITDVDVNVFAKSKHVGSSCDFASGKNHTILRVSQLTNRHKRTETPTATPTWHYRYLHSEAPSGHEHGTDLNDSLKGDAQTMLLGRIFHFDRSVAFEGSPIKRHAHYSVGELRFAHSDNKTEPGGSQRWEEVPKRPFELIIRGVLNYQLPLSSRVLSAAVTAAVQMHPEEGRRGGKDVH